MSWQDLLRNAPVSRISVGAHDAFLLVEPERFHVVETGHVDLFAVLVDEKRDTVTRKPFVSRIGVDGVFFEPPIFRHEDEQEGYFAFLAVPGLNTVLVRGERRALASADDFVMTSVVLVDAWVAKASDFIARYEPPPHNPTLLEADPDVPYEAGAVLSAHHLEVLWASADQESHFMGRPEFPVPRGALMPLTERTRLALPDAALVSAAHTPQIILNDQLWPAVDQYNAQILRCAEAYWRETALATQVLMFEDRQSREHARNAIFSALGDVLGDRRTRWRGGRSHRTTLAAAVSIIAESMGVEFTIPPDVPQEKDPFAAVRPLVAPSGIRTRRILLTPGWESRDGPSFLGVTPGEDQRPVAVVNTGGGVYEATDPASGETVRVNREVAEGLGAWGTMFYPPLSRGVDSAWSAIREALRGRGRDLRRVVLMGAVAAVFGLLTPVLTGRLLAQIIPRVDIPTWTAALVAMTLSAFVVAAVSIVGGLSMLRVEARIDETLQAAVWNRLISLSPQFFRRYLAGDLADRANGVSLIRQLLTGATGGSVVTGVFSVFSLAMLFYYSWKLALWSGAMMLLLGAATWLATVRQVRHTRAALATQGKINGLVFQMILGLAKLRQANAEIHVLRLWSERYLEEKRETLSARYWAAAQLAINALFAPASQLVLLGLIWFSLIGGANPTRFGLADFLSFHAVYGVFVAGVTGLTASWTTVAAVLPLFERVLPIIKAQPESVHGGVILPALSGRIEFENVSFRYPSAARDTLQDIGFRIAPGEYVAFVGSSGAGKSTLYRLLLGFERPTAGSVLIDGHDLGSLDLGAMRRQMGVVLQNGQLVPDSIFRNLVGEGELTRDAAWEALREVGLYEDVKAMPMELDTILSESGGGLSGGQKQRLLVARALARKPRVLLFDEATSMLDNQSQSTIQATLEGLAATRVLIAHRLNTVINVDRIYVMQAGRIVETGSYDELMQRGGALSELVRRQVL